MARKKQKKWQKYHSPTRCVGIKAATTRIRRYLIEHQRTFHLTGDPDTRESLPALRVAKETDITRERTRLILSRLRICGRPAHDYIVQATVASPATIAIIRQLWMENPLVKTIVVSMILRENHGRRVGDNLIRKILRSFRGKLRERHSKRAS